MDPGYLLLLMAILSLADGAPPPKGSADVPNAINGNVTMEVTGDGLSGNIVQDGKMYLTCNHNVPSQDLERAEFMRVEHTTGTFITIAMHRPGSGTECGLGDYKDRAVCSQNDGNDGQTLTVNQVTYSADNAPFFCEVIPRDLPQMVSNTITASVHVQMDPESTRMVPPPTPEDLTVSMVCETVHRVKPLVQILWSFRGNTVHGKEETQCDETDSEYCSVKSVLTLTNHQTGDEVTCTIKQEYPFPLTEITHRYEFDFVRLITNDGVTSINISRPINLLCEHDYDSEEINEVQWNKDSDRVATLNGNTCTLGPSYSDRQIHCGVKNEGGGHTLSITHSVREDSGRYTCVIDFGSTIHSSNSLRISVGGAGQIFPLYHSICLVGSMVLLFSTRI